MLSSEKRFVKKKSRIGSNSYNFIKTNSMVRIDTPPSYGYVTCYVSWNNTCLNKPNGYVYVYACDYS